MDPLPPTPQPSSDDLRLIVTIYHQVGSYFWWLLTTGFAIIVGLVWRAGGDRQRAFSLLKEQGDKLDKHDIRITALEQGAVVIAVKIGELPTRGELVAQTTRIDERFDRLDSRFDSLVSNPQRSA